MRLFGTRILLTPFDGLIWWLILLSCAQCLVSVLAAEVRRGVTLMNSMVNVSDVVIRRIAALLLIARPLNRLLVKHEA